MRHNYIRQPKLLYIDMCKKFYFDPYIYTHQNQSTPFFFVRFFVPLLGELFGGGYNSIDCIPTLTNLCRLPPSRWVAPVIPVFVQHCYILGIYK